MAAYGSHCPRGEPVTLNSTVIAVSNCSFSFIAGFAVFAAMGHLAKLQNTTVDELPYAGFSLVFGTWPVVFGTFEGGIHWVRLLFVNLFLLGIDSGFSILESPVCVFTDWFHAAGIKVPHYIVAGVGCIFGFAIGMPYGEFRPFLIVFQCRVSYLTSMFSTYLLTATDAGLFFLDAVDFYINFVLLIIGLMEVSVQEKMWISWSGQQACHPMVPLILTILECVFQTFAAGWMANLDKQIASLGHAITLTYMIGTFGSILVACCLWFGVDGDGAVWSGFVALILGYVGTHALTAVLCARKIAEDPDKWTWSSILYEVTLMNVMELRSELQSYCGWIPMTWAVMMRHLIPQILFILFINLATSQNDDGEPLFGNYGNYKGWPYQVLGIGTVVIAFVMFVLGLVYPDLYKKADLYALEMEQQAELKANGKFEDGSKKSSEDAGLEEAEA